MKRKVKKILILALICAFSLSSVSMIYAESDNKLNSNKTAEYIYGITYPNGTSLSEQKDYYHVTTVKDPTFDGIVDEKGNITVPTIREMKERFLKKFGKDPNLYKDSINKIDSIVDETINFIESQKSNNFSTAAVTAGILGSSYWYKEPWLDKTTNGITYSTTWVGYDNYRSSVASTCTYSDSTTTTKTLGFTGDSLIKDKFGFSASYSSSQTASVSTSTVVPAWTVWDIRPYIVWTQYDYVGIWRTETYDPIHGTTTYSDRGVYGTNINKRVSNNEAWSATNTSKSTTAKTPTPPTGVPNVDWQ